MNEQLELAWEENFPKGYGHTSISYLKRCPGFEAAKNGDLDAAHFVVSRCVKQNRIHELRERYPNAVMLPVLGRNKIPLALAQEIGLPIWYGVWIIHVNPPRKLMCAMQRLVSKPIFIGHIQKGLTFILVDDVVTQGGTMAALREFVTLQTGKVIAAVALAYTIGSHAIAPMKWYLIRLMVKFGVPLVYLLRKNEIASEVWELTNSQVKYLLRFASVGNIEKKMTLANSPALKL